MRRLADLDLLFDGDELERAGRRVKPDERDNDRASNEA
jgi:hypothetical protein